MRRDKMFHVLVLGGVALVGAGCGGGAMVTADAGSKDGDAYSDGPVEMDSSEDADSGLYEGFFPSETATPVDASFYVEPEAEVADRATSVLDASADVGYQFPGKAP